MKKLLALILACLLVPLPGFATIFGTATAWDVKGLTGSDTNGGAYDGSVVAPGTNESLGSPCVFTDLTLSGTGTTATSATCPFSSTTHGPGNFLQITSGTGCTPAVYEELSQSAGTGTFNVTMGTAASVCTGKLGGPMATIGKPISLLQSSGNTIHIQVTTYTVSATLATVNPVIFDGYTTNHGDLDGTLCATNPCPLVTTATNSTILFSANINNLTVYRNLSMSNSASTRAMGIVCLSSNGRLVMDNIVMDGFAVAIGNSGTSCIAMNIHRIEVKNGSGANVLNLSTGGSSSLANLSDSYIHANSTTSSVVIAGAGSSVVTINNIFASNTGAGGAVLDFGAASSRSIIRGNTLANNTILNGINTNTGTTVIENNILWNTATGGSGSLNGTNATYPNADEVFNNAFGSNFADPYTGVSPVTLGVDPFTNAAGGDYSLNSAATGGTLLKGTGYPGAFPGNTSTGHTSIGAVQLLSNSSSSSSGPYGYVR